MKILATNTKPVESCSKLELEELPPRSTVFPTDEGERLWVVSNVGGVMEPTPADLHLEARNVSQCSGFPNGTVALVPVGYKEFVKITEGWKRIRTADSEGVNVTYGRAIGPGETFYGSRNFLEVQQPRYTGGGAIATPLQEVNLRVLLSWVNVGMIPDSFNVPAFQDGGVIPQKLSLIIMVSVDGGKTKTQIYKGSQFNTRINGSLITMRQLVVYAADVVTALMKQARGERSILCVDNIELDPDDVLLDKLEQVSQGSFCVKIGVRDFQLPAGLTVDVNALQARIP